MQGTAHSDWITTPQRPRERLRSRLDEVIARSHATFLEQQRAEGYWHAPLEANVAMDAQYIFLNRFMGRCPQIEARVVEHMLTTQSDDGSWPLYDAGPGHLSNTIEAYFALKLAGHAVDEAPLRRARDFIKAHGGLAKAGVFTRTFLAYFGQFPWWGLPAMPVELVLLPAWFPLNIYAMSSWARGTVVPLTVLMAKRPSIAVGARMDVQELWLAPPTPESVRFPASPTWLTWRNFFLAADRALTVLGRSPWKPWRARALQHAEAWIVAHQDVNGGWGGIQPAMINSVMALRALGYRDDHPAIARGVQAVDDFLIDDDGQLFFQPCVSPTWDTALAAKALLDSGLAPNHPALTRAAEWLIGNQIFKPGDWQIYNPGLRAGGWAFEFANDWYPDVDDTAVILMVLQRIATADAASTQRALAHGIDWVLGMQSRNGGWGAFDTDNDAEFLNQIPFADMEAMIDPPTEDLTGRLLELMGNIGVDLNAHRARRARNFILRTQRADGSWWGSLGRQLHLRHVVGALRIASDRRRPARAAHPPRRGVAAGAPEHRRRMGRNAAFLRRRVLRRQGRVDGIANRLGGPRSVGRGARRDCRIATRRRISARHAARRRHMGRASRSPAPVFPRHFYLRYDMYRNYFPLMALGQFRQRLADTDGGPTLTVNRNGRLQSRPESQSGGIAPQTGTLS